MSVVVAGVENFVGNIKRAYRRRGAVSDDPMRHHIAYHEANGADGRVIDHAIVDEPAWLRLVESWERDPRRLFAHPVWLSTGYVSYVLYESRTRSPRV